MIERPYLRWRGRFCPIIDIKLGHNGNITATTAFLDTGATFSVFSEEVSDDLGLVFNRGERVDIVVGDGGFIPVFLHNIRVEIEGKWLDARIGFSDRLGTGINILGRETVFDQFLICFDERRRVIQLHTYGE